MNSIMDEKLSAKFQDIQNRHIRVFISSTFKDMKEEREILVKRVFPQLRKICEERSVTWGEVDLRWGVTDEQKAEGKVLPICLEEIKRCRPYFIGLLGERYGWVPDEISQDLIDGEPWLKDHLSNSVTELEILQGVLNNPDMAEHAFFYFRDPTYIDSIPDEDHKDFTAENAECTAKLNHLKERIRKSGFPVRANYSNPKALEALVLEDFISVINKQYPPDEKLDPLDRAALDHDAFAQSRAQVYIGREEYFNRLDEHIQSDKQPLIILGESGSGKSALLANWAIKYRKDHPDVILLMHFIGATPYSSDWAAMIRRIMAELKRRFDIQQEIPDKPDELRSAFANWLHMASAKGKAIIILDALNQLEDREGALDLVWLPPSIPENIRLILSTLPGSPLDDLKKRQWPTLNIQPLSFEERKDLISFYLRQYTKTLSDPRVEKIASSEHTANPLYLKVLLEELRQFGKHERLDERIDYYLQAKDPYELYARVLVRWEEDYEEGDDLVGDALSLIWASRRGLTESELLEILGTDESPFPSARWSPLFLAARESLISRSGLLNFGHNFIRDSVRNTYIPTEEHQEKAHLRLANYFEKQELTPRKADELPWQLRQGNAPDNLYNLLSDLPFFDYLWEKDEFDVKAYWSYLEGKTLRMTDAYKRLIEDPESIDNKIHISKIATLLADTGHPRESFSLMSFLVNHYRETNQIENLLAHGELDEAMEPLLEMERIKNLQASLHNQALILQARGELDEAMGMLKEVERIYRELGEKDGLAVSLGSQANIHYSREELDEAMRLNKEQERICRELGNKKGLSISLGNQAVILQNRGELDEAMRLYKEQERICRELGNKDGLSRSFGGQANIHYSRGELDEAMRLHKEEERICRELGDKNGLSRSLALQAFLLSKKMNRHQQALPLAEESFRIVTKYDFENLKAPVGNILDHIKAHISNGSNQYLKVDIPTAHHGTNPGHAAQLNIKYQEELKKWKELPWWKRRKVKKPERPDGI